MIQKKKLIKEMQNINKKLKKQIWRFIENLFQLNIFGDVQYFILDRKQIVINLIVVFKNNKLLIYLITCLKMEIALSLQMEKIQNLRGNL